MCSRRTGRAWHKHQIGKIKVHMHRRFDGQTVLTPQDRAPDCVDTVDWNMQDIRD